MDRVIKFRGISTETGKWVYGDLIQSKPNKVDGGFSCWIKPRDILALGAVSTPTSLFIEVIKSSVGQFTGLLDKNGVEIYENDVVETPYEMNVGDYSTYEGSETGLYRGKVHYRPSCGYMQAKVIRQEHDSGSDDWMKNNTLERIIQNLTRVIGNIYENPELLKPLPSPPKDK